MTNTKRTMHKSCSCRSCRRGRGSSFGHSVHHLNEKKLRQRSRIQLATRDPEDIEIAPISSPYTD